MTPVQLGIRIVIVTLSRLLLNTAKRFIYTFAPALSRFLGVPLTSITSLIAINQGISVLGIMFAPLGDRFGYKLLMLGGLASLTAGLFAAGILPVYATLVFTVIVAGLGKTIFDPAIQAYVGIRVPFERRGLVIGILELAWAGSTIVGIPLAGLLIDKAGWQYTFIFFGALSLLCFILILVIVPWDKGINSQGTSQVKMLQLWKNLLKNRAALGALIFSFFISIANDNIFVIYASWLESSFALSIVALGIGTSVIGFSEIVGEMGTALFADRIGLKKAVIAGAIGSIISFILLPFFDGSLFSALIALFFIFLTFEFTVVCTISLGTELSLDSRATMMSGIFALAGIGRMIGAVIGGPIWINGGLWATGLVSAGCTFLGLIGLVWGLKGWKASTL
ncbi:MAG: MFS transporter [Proteobacteria bacterium]|nr:MFS transporter [Pseudomonadota bacterium]